MIGLRGFMITRKSYFMHEK